MPGEAVDRTAAAARRGRAAWVQVSPTELVLKPGQTVEAARAASSTRRAEFLREEQATWSLDGLERARSSDGTFTRGAGRTRARPA